MNKVLLIIGIIALVLGIFAQVYSVTTTHSQVFGLFTTTETTNPFDYLSVPLIAGGIILIIVGLFVRGDSNKK